MRYFFVCNLSKNKFMNYVLAISGANYGEQSSYLAVQFAQVLIMKGHSIHQIFFLQNGVTNANSAINMPSDEINLLQEWQAFHHHHQVPLHLCVSASQRRGINEKNLAKPFILAGLGEFTQAVLQADRFIQF